MEWLEVTIETSSDGIEFLEAVLSINGYDSFSVCDEQDFENFLQTNKDYWDVIDNDLSKSMQGVSFVRLYLENNASAMEELYRLKDLLSQIQLQWLHVEFGSLKIDTANIKNEDWENNWKQYYKPIEIGEKLLVVPKWMASDNPNHRIPILLDPGMIFGTGAHASTQMCMKALEAKVHGGEQVIDLGSGSGILSITAILLGAANAVGVDVDPKAEDIARENAAFNHIYENRFQAVTGNILLNQESLSDLLSKTYDIVCMNIFADIIIPMAPILPGIMHDTSVVICSGILNTRLDSVRTSLLDAGLLIENCTEQDDWCCIIAKKK